MNEQLIGNYRILEKIGSGGMGDVFRGFDVMLEREVAIKSLRPEWIAREDVIDRFRREAVAMGKLSHPNIATVYNFLLHEGKYYLILEFVRGQPLDKILEQRGPLDYTEVLTLLGFVLDGLAHAHEGGIVHRDIKPGNIMVTASGPKIMDFGIARILEQTRQTRAGHMVGTLEYMSPEHIKGLDTDARTDIYSVGIVAYELLTGALPFRKDTDYEIIEAQVHEAPRPLRAVLPRLPVSVEQVVSKALAKDADARYQSAAAFAAALRACCGVTETGEGRLVTGPRLYDLDGGEADADDQGPSGLGRRGLTALFSSRLFLRGLIGTAVTLLLGGAGLFIVSSLEETPSAPRSGSATSAPAQTLAQVRQGAEANDPVSQLELGERYDAGNGLPKDPVQALAWYRKAAEAGQGKAQLLLGKASLLGRGTPVDLGQAEHWLTQAAQAQVPGAAGQLGEYYGSLHQYEKALAWYLKSKEQGDRLAPLHIGFAYVNMEDYAKAIPWLEQAAEAGAVEAKFSLGMICYNGYGGEKNYGKALEYFQVAANQNHPESQFMLGVMYHYGYGVTVDLLQARKWLRLALANGYASASKELNMLP